MDLEVTLDGQPTAEKIRAIPDLLKQYMLGAFIQGATLVASQASANVSHVSRGRAATGELAGSMHIKVSEKGSTYSVSVGPDAYYAGWVESGHAIVRHGERNRARLARRFGMLGYARVSPHPYFMPAVAAARAEYSAFINDAIARAEQETQGR